MYINIPSQNNKATFHIEYFEGGKRIITAEGMGKPTYKKRIINYFKFFNQLPLHLSYKTKTFLTMKKLLFSVLSLSILGLYSQEKKKEDVNVVEGKKYKQLEIGDALPNSNESMVCSNTNTNHTLKDLSKENGVLVIFSCNTCPFVLEWEKEYPSIKELADERKIGIVLINSNEAKRKNDDSKEEMSKHAKDKGYSNIPYLVDNNSMLANKFGANTTPHIFLFDKNNKLVYKGAIDDRYENKDRKITKNYLKDAMSSLSNNKKIKTQVTVNKGCSIKRV